MQTSSAEKRVRTCIGCGARSDKMKLLRIVRSADGAIAFDASGRAAGRGAYVCSLACLESAAKAKKVQRALKMNVGHDEIERIAAEMIAAMSAEGDDKEKICPACE